MKKKRRQTHTNSNLLSEPTALMQTVPFKNRLRQAFFHALRGFSQHNHRPMRNKEELTT